mmetsp:Transcript_23215/g.78617  ORF Transcript_23215/g.78617 Transcript_23215/m.78617 type:complete len:579 (-) Transcript_23215:53-1789(-)
MSASILISFVIGVALLCAFGRAASSMTIPIIALCVVVVAYFMQGALNGVSFSLGAKNATLDFSADAAELTLIKAMITELNSNLFGADDTENSGQRLSSLVSLLRDAEKVEAKTMEVKSILSTFNNNSEAVDAFLVRHSQKMDSLVRSAVGHALNLTTQEFFWEQLRPRLAEAGLLNNIEPELMLRIEQEKARVQEEMRAKHGVDEKVARVHIEGWMKTARSMSEDFNEHLPFRAFVFLLVCAAFFALHLGYQIVLRRVKIPQLIEETSVGSWRRRPKSVNSKGLEDGIFKAGKPEIILEDDVRDAVSDMAQVAMWAGRKQLRGGKQLALPNAVFYGPPGTGKSLTARRLATACGLDYAIMSGGNVIGLQEEAVPELRRIFNWARRVRKGLVLFVDEADAFLSARGAGGSPFVQAAVSFFLAQTTSSSTRLLIILATNRARDLDEAVLSRMPFQIEFGKPNHSMVMALVKDRLKGLGQDAAKRLVEVLKGVRSLDELGFVGRDIQSLFEEFERRWSLECAAKGQDAKKADIQWLRRWLKQRTINSSDGLNGTAEVGWEAVGGSKARRATVRAYADKDES